MEQPNLRCTYTLATNVPPIDLANMKLTARFDIPFHANSRCPLMFHFRQFVVLFNVNILISTGIIREPSKSWCLVIELGGRFIYLQAHRTSLCCIVLWMRNRYWIDWNVVTAIDEWWKCLNKNSIYIWILVYWEPIPNQLPEHIFQFFFIDNLDFFLSLAHVHINILFKCRILSNADSPLSNEYDKKQIHACSGSFFVEQISGRAEN